MITIYKIFLDKNKNDLNANCSNELVLILPVYVFFLSKF